ncbi:MAG: hypothetical protein OXL96_26930 [Candidatus Poribacteria bacterium]|nr:hypothetical protein [Candidatus Poribacteria bacterium]
MRKYRTWHEVLVEQLMDPEEALDYLQFAIGGYQKDGDTSFFLRALRTVAESQGGIAEVAKKIGIAPESLSEILASDDPPRIDTFGTILNAFGWQLSIEPLENVELNIKTQNDKRVDLNTAAKKRASSVVEAP